MFLFYSEPTEHDLQSMLNDLINSWEGEVVEFKEANNDYDQDKIGQYFSAISNEANLKGLQYGWLVFGVRNKDKKIVGSAYRDTAGLEKLKQEIAQNTTGGISFIDIFEVFLSVDGEKKRVVMFKIPAAVNAIPTGWKNHYYGRNGESIGALSIEEQERIRSQRRKDWSKQTINGSSIDHLDKTAIAIARENYKKTQNRQHISEEVDSLSDEEFFTKIKLIIDGKLTNAAMVLLGNSDYDYLMDSPPRIMWRLYAANGEDKDYEQFTIPFITVVDKVYDKIRNLTYRYMPNQLTLFPTETQQYDSWLLRELLNNCIAHQDYTIGGRIYVNEFEDRIKITNPGSFLPGDIQAVLKPSYAPPYYRNQLLADAMVKFHMIDTATMGIRKVFRIQKNKYFPLPDYDTSNSQEVAVTIYGKVLDLNYTRLLFNNQDWDLDTVYLLDRVQKSQPITKDQVKYLRKLGVIEGKVPNIYLAAPVAKEIDERAQYIKNKGFDDEYYKKLIIDYLKKWGKGKKKDFVKLLFNKLPDVMDEKQKEYKVRNLLSSMKAAGIIDTDSDNNRIANWVLVKEKSANQ